MIDGQSAITATAINNSGQLETYTHAGQTLLEYNRFNEDGSEIQNPDDRSFVDSTGRVNLLYYPKKDPKDYSLNAYCDNDTLKFTGCDIKLKEYAYIGSDNQDICSNNFEISENPIYAERIEEERINCEGILNEMGTESICHYTNPPEGSENNGTCGGANERIFLTHTTEIYKPDISSIISDYTGDPDHSMLVPKGEDWVDCSNFIEYINHKVFKNDSEFHSIKDQPKYPYIKGNNYGRLSWSDKNKT